MTLGRGAADCATDEKSYRQFTVESTPGLGLEELSETGCSVESSKIRSFAALAETDSLE
jgi:hypothetical protein